MNLTSAQHDRSAGVLLGVACGDALGAGYEFSGPLAPEVTVTMRGGDGVNWAPGEWTDYTSMGVPIALATAAGRDLRQDSVLDDIVAEWVGWSQTARFAGRQLGTVLGETAPTAAAIRLVARRQHERSGQSAGNGSLLRTAPVALAFLHDQDGLAEAARAVSGLTHCEEDAGDACVLWGLAIRHAVLEGRLDLRIGLPQLSVQRRALWAARIDEAERREPKDFIQNGWVVQTLQGAWSAIMQSAAAVGNAAVAAAQTAGPGGAPACAPADHLRWGLEAAVRGGGDTDAVAAVAGGLLAARWGLEAVPSQWRRLVHGWPGLRGPDLVRLAVLTSHWNDSNEAGERQSFRLHAVR
jgi:ADP-ribosyl-[dinitrogen reductase] hydrolase